MADIRQTERIDAEKIGRTIRLSDVVSSINLMPMLQL